MSRTDFDAPTFCRIEYLNENGEWWVGHAGYNLMNPAAYVEKLVGNGHHARVIATVPGGPDSETFVLPETLAEQKRRLTEEGTSRLVEGLDLPKEVLDTEVEEDMMDDLDDLLAEFEDEADETPEEPTEETTDDLPGMWEESDLSGGEADSETDLFADFEEMMLNSGSFGGDLPEDNGLLVKDPAGIGSLDYIFNGHKGAGPSAAERWMNCTASLGASLAFLETLDAEQAEQFSVANEAARQGTTAHAAAEVEARVILGQMDQNEADLTLMELAVEPPDGEFYDEEMADYIIEYVDLVRQYAQDRGDDHMLIEQRVSAAVPLTDLHEGEVYEVTGSGDCIVLPTSEEPTLVVGDLKYGKGIDVDVDENPQIRIYALGALGLLVDDEGNLITDVDEVVYHIVQPRLGGIKTWSESLDDLLAWRDEVLAPALTKALFGVNEGATYEPSELACQFCPARGGCAALAEQRVEQAADLFDTVVEAEFTDGPGAFPETSEMTDTRLGELLTQITGLIDIHKDLKAEAERRLYRGGSVPGFKLVSYTPPRKWKPEAAEQLDDRDDMAELWQRKLITPTQAEKALGERYAEIEPLVDKPDKRPVVASEGDRRKDWTGRDPESMFDIENEG